MGICSKRVVNWVVFLSLGGAINTGSYAFGQTAFAPGTAPMLHAAAPAELALPDAPSARMAEGAGAPDPAAAAYLQKPFVNYTVPLEDQPHHPVTFQRGPKMVIEDLSHIAIAPLYLRTRDLKWILPVAGAAAVAFAEDTHTMRDVVSHDPSFNNAAINVSDGLRDTFIGVPIVMAFGGQLTHNDHVRETGILGGEAMIDAIVVDGVVKLASFRERPATYNSRGDFYDTGSGTNSSFVSGHCMVSWSSAAVIAGEYSNPWIQAAAYTGATGVALDRVLGREHFPSDVLLGSVGGWLIGHYVYRAHHHALHGKKDVAERVMLGVLTHVNGL